MTTNSPTTQLQNFNIHQSAGSLTNISEYWTQRLEYYAHFTNAIQECRWQDTDAPTIILSRNFQGWPIRHLFQRNIIQVKQITTLEPSSMHHIVCQSQAKNWSSTAISMKDWETSHSSCERLLMRFLLQFYCYGNPPQTNK